MFDFDEAYARSVFQSQPKRVERLFLRAARAFAVPLIEVAAVYDGRDDSLTCVPAQDVSIELDLVTVKPKQLLGAEDKVLFLALEPSVVQVLPSIWLFRWQERPSVIGRC